MIFAIAWRELRSLFLSPLAWVILGVVQMMLGYFFYIDVDWMMNHTAELAALDNSPGVTQMIVPDVLGKAAFVLLLVSPLITMRLLAEERRNKTLALLFSAPVSVTEIVLGKYLGTLGFLTVMVALIGAMLLVLQFGTQVDLGMLISGLLGLELLLASFTAVGLFMSSLTQHQTISAMMTFGCLLLFWMLRSSEGSYGVLSYLSLINHYKPFLEGLFDSVDALYHVLFTSMFLVFTIRRLDADRIGG